MTINDLMKRPAITCHVNETLDRAARLMWGNDIGAIVVVRDDGKVTGMITDRDICMAAFTQGRPIADLLVHSAMSNHVVTVRPDQRIEEVEEAMRLHQLHRIPVVDSEHRPLGVITLNDLALEAVDPDSNMTQGRTRIATIVASIGRPRFPHLVAA